MTYIKCGYYKDKIIEKHALQFLVIFQLQILFLLISKFLMKMRVILILWLSKKLKSLIKELYITKK